jgi:DNA-binding winged helix-turn-helix (wHTH) protein
MQVRFGDFILDTDTRELSRKTRPIHLSPKAFQLLHMLVENRPKALSKASLQEHLWPDTFVVEANLSNLVGEVRAALNDDPRRPHFVRTVHAFGYAFRDTSAVDAASSSPPRYRLAWKGGHATVADGEHVLGRDPALALSFDSASVSRRHARLLIAEGEAVLEDLASKNGTYVNDQRVTTAVRVSNGDEVRIGSVRLTFRVLDVPPSTETRG